MENVWRTYGWHTNQKIFKIKGKNVIILTILNTIGRVEIFTKITLMKLGTRVNSSYATINFENLSF